MTIAAKAKDEKRPFRALIADDDAALLRFMATRFAKLGFEVETAVNGVQALLKARKFQPDVLVTDLNMPEADGLTIVRRIVSQKLPIRPIIVSASSSPETAAAARISGADFFRKGPNLWNELRAHLSAAFPDLLLAQEAEEPAAPIARIRPAVLFINGDPSVGAFYASRLRKNGIDVLLAEHALDGFQAAVREQPSVIVADYETPNGDARYLLWKLRSTAATATTPLVMLTAVPLDGSLQLELAREVCGGPGVEAFLVKSNQPEPLFDAIRKHCAFVDHQK